MNQDKHVFFPLMSFGLSWVTHFVWIVMHVVVIFTCNIWVIRHVIFDCHTHHLDCKSDRFVNHHAHYKD